MLEKGHSLQGKRDRREDGGPGTVGRRPWAVLWGQQDSREWRMVYWGKRAINRLVRTFCAPRVGHKRQRSPAHGPRAVDALDSRCLTPTLDVLTLCWNPELKHITGGRRRDDISYWCSKIWASVRNEFKSETMYVSDVYFAIFSQPGDLPPTKWWWKNIWGCELLFSLSDL